MFFTKDFFEWLEDDGFYIKDTWDEERHRSAGPGFLKLMPIQERILRECLTLREDGTFPYETVVYSTIKKSGKTAIAAAVAAWFLECCPDGTELYTIANSQDQAEGRILKDIKYHLKKRNEALEYNVWKIGQFRCENRDTGTFVEALTQSYQSNAGTDMPPRSTMKSGARSLKQIGACGKR